MADSIGTVGLVVSSDISQFQSDMGKAALIAEREMQRTAAATQIADKAASRFIQSLKDEAATFGKTREEILRYQAAQKGVSDEAEQYIQRLAQMQSASKNSGAKELAKEMEHVGFQSAGAKRELLVLAHELSQGNYKRFAGSLMVIGERTNIMSLAFSGAGLAIIGAAAAVGGFIALVIKGAMEQSHFNKSLIATNDYAGVTAQGFQDLARAAAAATNTTIGAAKQMEQAFVSSGRVGPGNLSLFEQTALLQERVTGQAADEIVKDYVKMADGVTKWAEETNKSYHFLTVGQYEHIRALEEQGRMEEAERVALQALQGQLTQATTNLGYMERGWHAVKNAISEAIDAMKRWGQESPVADAQAQLAFAKAQQQRALNMGGSGKAEQGAVTAAQDNLRTTQMEEFRKAERAAAKAQADADNERAIKASDFLKNLREQVSEQAKLNKELTEYHAAVKAMAAAGKPVSAAQQARDEAAIRARFGRKGIAEAAKEDNARLQEQQQKLKDALKAQEDALKFHSDYVKALYAAGQISEARYYASVRKDDEQALKDKLDYYAKDIAALQAHMASYHGKDRGAEQIKINRQIAHDRAEAEKAQQDAAQKTILSNIQEAQSMKMLSDQVLNFQAQLLSMGGDVAGAADIKNRIAMENAQRLAIRAGAPTTTGDFARFDRGQSTGGIDLAAMQKALDMQKEMAADKAKVAQITSTEKTAEELYALTATKSGITLAQQERYIHGLRQAALDQMEQMVISAEKMAATAGPDSPMILFAKQLRLEFEKARETVDPFITRMNEANKQLADGIASDVTNAITKWKSFGDLLASIGDTMLKIAAQTLFEKPFATFLQGAFSSAGGGFFGSIGSLLGFAGGGNPPVGVPSLVGENGPELFVPSTAGTIIPNSALSGMGAGGGITIQISAVVGDIASKSDVVSGMQTVAGQIIGQLTRSKMYGGAAA